MYVDENGFHIPSGSFSVWFVAFTELLLAVLGVIEFSSEGNTICFSSAFPWVIWLVPFVTIVVSFSLDTTSSWSDKDAWIIVKMHKVIMLKLVL